MKNGCAECKDLLLEAALTGATVGILAEHLRECSDCTTELAALRARREQLDTLLPAMTRGAEPSAGFRTRILAAAEAADQRKRMNSWRGWVLVATATVVVALVIGLTLELRTSRKSFRTSAQTSPETELATAQKLADWRAPSDVLLQIPGQEMLHTTPRLGESYLRVSANKNREE